jgi:putative endonuclease
MGRRAFGKIGEQHAVGLLTRKGYQIVGRNVQIGRGEIDIIAKDGETLVFVEVKTGRRSGFGNPEERVNLAKQRQLGKLAQQYLQNQELHDVSCRFDVVAVESAASGWKMRHIESAFSLERD